MRALISVAMTVPLVLPMPLARPLPLALTPRHAPPRADASHARSLDAQEMEAIAGIWDLHLDLDDGDRTLTIHLSPSSRLSVSDASIACAPLDQWDASEAPTASAATPSSQHATQLSSPHSPSPAHVNVRLRIGDLTLLGRGTRDALRCSEVCGSVLEGKRDPCCVGSFSMRLTMPAVDDAALPSLERKREVLRDSRPAPPIRYSRDSFFGTWRLFLALDDCNPRLFTLNLRDRSFSTATDGGEFLGGTWGVWTKDAKRVTSVEPEGDHLWLRIERDRCSSSLSGIGGLPVRESFQVWGHPKVGSPMAELAARGGGAAALRNVARLACRGLGLLWDGERPRVLPRRHLCLGAPGRRRALTAHPVSCFSALAACKIIVSHVRTAILRRTHSHGFDKFTRAF